jgi:hypothetical protein
MVNENENDSASGTNVSKDDVRGDNLSNNGGNHSSNNPHQNNNNRRSPEAEARYRKVREFIATKSKFVSSKEFEGEGKVMEILDVDPDAQGKYGPVVQYKVREPNINAERIWNCASIGALKAVHDKLEQGINMMRIRKTGSGSDTKYFAE